jgi:hypothetical protein
MLVVNRLAADAERLRDLAPGPAEPPGVLDVEILELVQPVAERHDRSESVARLIALFRMASEVDSARRHGDTLSTPRRLVNER